MKTARMFVAILLCLFVGVSDTKGAVITTCVENPGTNTVICTTTGSISFAGLTVQAPGSSGPQPVIVPVVSIFQSGGPVGVTTIATRATGVAYPANIGTGNQTFPFASSGPPVGLSGGTRIFFPDGYVSGTPLLTSTASFNGSFATLGLASGPHTWTWGGGSAPSDSWTLNTISVPEPTTFLCLSAVGLVVAGFATSPRFQRRRR